MIQITDAKWIRLVERDGRQLAEVEFRTNHPEFEQGVAYVAKTEDRSDPYRIAMVFRKEADADLDWFDNSYHQAYTELSNSFTDNRNEDWERLCEDAIRFGAIRGELDRYWS